MSRVSARRTARTVPALALMASYLWARSLDASPASDELVRQARSHERSHEEDIALRRYGEALSIDRENAEAWMGLAALRLRLGEPDEAERVYEAAIGELPTLRDAWRGRAQTRWTLGRHAEAEADLEACAELEADPSTLRQLAEWFGVDGRTSAQLATWRRLLIIAERGDDRSLEREARRMVRALVILVDGADPAASPVLPDETRRAMARIAARGG